MVIEHAERFGLSQLHQLRGRVGRGAAASACVLLYSSPRAAGWARRARAPARHGRDHDGFEIARRDLEIRGPGEFLGARQSGAALLRFADLDDRHGPAGVGARAGAAPAGPHPDLAARHVERWLGGKSDYLQSLIAMTLTELKYIVAVAREKHFGKAAEACFVSQPTLSVAIKKLEDELEVKLFERSAGEVSVTPLGEEIVRQAQSVLEQAAAIKEIAKRGKDPLAGPLKLGVIYTIGPYLLPDLVRHAIRCRRRCR
jgi:DNA-binding MarR family transcriptional regulator